MNDKKNNKKDSAYNQDVTTNYQDTFYIIPRYIRKLPKITLAYLDIYESIFQFWNKGKDCFLSEEGFIEKTGYKRASIYNALNYFEKHKEIQRIWFKSKRYIIKPIKHDEDCIEIEPKSTVIDSNVYDSRQCTSTTVDNNIKNLKKESNLKESITFSNTKENNKSLLAKSQPLTTLQKINTLDLPNEYLEQLIAVRKANKASVSKLSMEAVYKELIKLKDAGFDLNECLNMYANCGWKGFIAEWFINSKAKNQSNHLDHDSMAWAEGFKNNPLYDMESYKNGR
jgi:hypothetical protein